MWFKILNLNYQIGYIPEELLFYRVGKHQGTATIYSRNRLLLDEFFVVLEKRYMNQHSNKLPLILLNKFLNLKFKDYYTLIQNGICNKRYDIVKSSIAEMNKLKNNISIRYRIKFFFKLLGIKIRLLFEK